MGYSITELEGEQLTELLKVNPATGTILYQPISIARPSAPEVIKVYLKDGSIIEVLPYSSYDGLQLNFYHIKP